MAITRRYRAGATYKIHDRISTVAVCIRIMGDAMSRLVKAIMIAIGIAVAFLVIQVFINGLHPPVQVPVEGVTLQASSMQK